MKFWWLIHHFQIRKTKSQILVIFFLTNVITNLKMDESSKRNLKLLSLNLFLIVYPKPLLWNIKLLFELETGLVFHLEVQYSEMQSLWFI